MENNKRNQRTPQEIIAETEAKLARLKMKEARNLAKEDPRIADLYDLRELEQKKIREAKKILGKGPQSGETRIEKHNSWISKIQEEMADAEDTILVAATTLDSLDNEIGEAIDRFTKEKSAEA